MIPAPLATPVRQCAKKPPIPPPGHRRYPVKLLSLSRMLTLFAALVVAGPVLAQAKPPSQSHLKAARELVQQTQIAKTFDAFVPQLGVQMIQRLEEDLKDEVVIESRPRLEGRQMVMMVAPKKK